MTQLTQTATRREIHAQSDIWREWGAGLDVALAQVLAAVWSDGLGLTVDDPFAGKGTLTRVVSNVKLHLAVPR
jgi:tagatose-6-phosphate ketose/aldose isomerase